MDIRNWPMDRIMQLPDFCFGRRWPVSVAAEFGAPMTAYDISEAALPEKCVVWGATFIASASGAAYVEVSLSLGDQLPTTDAQFDSLERLFSDLGYLRAGRRLILTTTAGGPFHFSFRLPVTAAGRRLVGRFLSAAGSSYPAMGVIIVSSIPTEVPDWLCSGRV